MEVTKSGRYPEEAIDATRGDKCDEVMGWGV